MGNQHRTTAYEACIQTLFHGASNALQGSMQWSAHYDRIKQHLECDHTETSRDDTRVVTTSYAGNPLMSLVN